MACVTKACTLPPRSETVVPLVVKRLAVDQNEICLVEPLPLKQNQQYLFAKTLVHIKNENMHSKLLNPTNKSIRIRRGTPIGTLQPVEPDSIRVLDEHTSSDLRTQESQTRTPKYTMQELGIKIENENLTAEQKHTLVKLIENNSDVFARSMADLKRTNIIQLEIDTGDATPQRQRPYRHPPAVRAEIDRQTKEMLENGIIEPSNSVWNSPCLLVQKKTVDQRLCIDYRKLNSVTKSMSFPLPTLPEVFETMAEAQPIYFSTIDLRSAYYQMEVEPNSREKDKFFLQFWLVFLKSVPFGLKNAPIFFQMLVTHIFRGMLFNTVVAYLDDIVVFSKTFEKHCEDLQEVFDRLRNANLMAHNSKCSFAVPEVLYLGHVLRSDGICVDENKIKVGKDWPRPKNQKDVRSFLRFCGYYRRFVRDFAKIATPLNNLLRKDQVTLIWDDNYQAAFEKLRTAMCTTPVLSYAKMDKPFIISCDASQQSIGYILSQLDETTNREKPIAYSGRSLRDAERRWGITEIEGLALIEAIREFNVFLKHQRFTVITDHISLKFLQNIKNQNGRLFRWSLLL